MSRKEMYKILNEKEPDVDNGLYKLYWYYCMKGDFKSQHQLTKKMNLLWNDYISQLDNWPLGKGFPITTDEFVKEFDVYLFGLERRRKLIKIKNKIN